MKSDCIYTNPLEQVVDFTFDEKVAAVFPDMLKRSVPGYSTVIVTTAILAERHFYPGSRVYDLGCSLGAASLAIRRVLQGKEGELIAVDCSEPMLRRAAELMELDQSDFPITFLQADICDIEIDNASIVVLNYTLQFVKPELRQALLDKIYQGLRPNGILILSEKIAFDDEAKQAHFVDLHHSFKSANGYSELEISQKRQALENVLIPETVPYHLQRLQQSGFNRADVWFQCFNFASLLAVK